MRGSVKQIGCPAPLGTLRFAAARLASAPVTLPAALLASRTASRCGFLMFRADLGVARGGIVLGSAFRGGALRLVLLAEAGLQPRTGLLCLVDHRPLHAPKPKGCLSGSPQHV